VIDAIDRTPDFDLVVVLQPTSPLREASDIDNCLELLIAKGAATAVSVSEARDHPFLVYSMAVDSRLDAFLSIDSSVSMRRQDLPPAYSLNGAIYIAEIDWLIASRSFVSPETVGYLMSREASVDIDEPSDLERAQVYLSDRRNA
jgi:CMP-N-acetylneuraminic acid synthetase